MKESLTKVLHSLEFAADDLRAAYNKADPVTAIILMELMKDNINVFSKVGELLNALESKEGG